ncbi:MAG: DUF6263 family protein [Chitinophagaceae bacterium]
MKRIAFIGLLFCSGMTMAQSLTRKAVLTSNQQLEKVATMKINFGMEMMGQTIDVSSDNNITSLVAVKKVSDKGYDVATTVKHIISNTGAMGQNMSYDSDKPGDENSELGKALKSGVNKTTNFSIDKKGFITATDDTTTTDNVEEKMAGMAGGMINGLNAAQNKIGGTFEVIAPVPDKTLKVGDTWVDSTSDKDSKQVSNYKVVTIDGTTATVALDGTLTRKGETEAQGMTINMDMKGKMTGEMQVEVATGIVKKRSMIMDGTGTMEIMGQSVPFTMKMTMGETVGNK